jgi:hypothetical protein
MSKRHPFETNMSREIEAHLEQATQDYIARGLPPEEARLRARPSHTRFRTFRVALVSPRSCIGPTACHPGYAQVFSAVLGHGVGE